MRTTRWGLIAPRMNPRYYVESLRGPVLSIIPEDDEIVPPNAQRSLFNAKPEPKEVYYSSGGHTMAYQVDTNMESVIVAWANRLPGLPAIGD